MLQQYVLLTEALDAYAFGQFRYEVKPFGKGHINTTYLVTTKKLRGGFGHAILQKVNTHVFTNPVGLMENIVHVTEWLRKKIYKQGGDYKRGAMRVLPTLLGKKWHICQDGSFWRSYSYVEGTVCHQVAETPAVFAAAGRAYGRFVGLMADFPPDMLHETIPYFHDTPRRLQALRAAVEADPLGRAKECQAEIAFALARSADCEVLARQQQNGTLPLRVTHNDTKLNNVLMDTTTGEDVCVVDLDTVMPGLAAHDFGDSIRSGAHTATEDERDLGMVSFSLPLYKVYLDAYLQAAGPALTPAERQSLPWGARLMTLECGMRFLTDYLEGDHYFRIHWPQHNLDRCRTQFKLLGGMEENWAAMQAAVAKE